ncbi:MAG: hypothetical protein Q9183_004161, partial [Haloplaca sp. 2 TL-2023]
MRQKEHSNCGESVGGCGPLLKVPCGAFGGDSCNYEAVNEQGFCQGCRGEEAQAERAEGLDPTAIDDAPVLKHQARNDPQQPLPPKPPRQTKAKAFSSAPPSAATTGTMAAPAPSTGKHLTVKLPGMDSKPPSGATGGKMAMPAPSEGDYITVKLPGMSSKQVIARASKTLATFPSNPSRIVTVHRDGKPSVQEGSPEASSGTATKSSEAQNLRLLVTALQFHWFNVCVTLTESDEQYDSVTLDKITDLAWRFGTDYKPETRYWPLAAGSHDPSAHTTGDASQRRQAHLLTRAMLSHWRNVGGILIKSQNKHDREILGQILVLASYLGSGREPIVREEPRTQSMGIGQTKSQASTAEVQERETPTEGLGHVTQAGDEFPAPKDVTAPR